MTSQPAVLEDRRRRRRQETIDEVLDIAVEIMAEQGVAGLSIGEIARRMGIRPPSLYVYFPSKHALYDALFARGARLVLDAMAERFSSVPEDATLESLLRPAADEVVRWTLAHRAYAQLLFWRPVPGFEPSPEAFAPSARFFDLCRSWFATMQRLGLVRRDVEADAVVRDWTVLGAGVISQQLSNAPEQAFEEGTYTAAIPSLVSMFARHYGARTKQRRRHRGDTR